MMNALQLLPLFLAVIHGGSYYCVVGGESADFDSKHKLIEHFLTVRSLDTVVLYTCWSHADRIKSMGLLNENGIAATHRNGEDFNGTVDLNDVLTISLYSPLLGIIVDWSCNGNVLFKYSESWMWNASYHWLMMMENDRKTDVESFLTSKNINLTVSSELLLAYPGDVDDEFVPVVVVSENEWRIFDVYRTAFEPRGKLVVDVVNETFGKWGNRLWKFDKRLNLANLTMNVVTIVNPYGTFGNANGTYKVPSSDELDDYLKTFNADRLNSGQKFSYRVMEPLTKVILNITLNIKTTKSWGFKINNKWDGIVGMILSGEVDFSVNLNAIRPERLDVVEYSGMSTWTHDPCFIFRHPRSSTTSMNIFLRPFEMTVWISLLGVTILSAFVYYTIIHFESHPTFCISELSDIFLLKIGTLCQQGTTIEPTKLSNRFIVLLMFVFSLVMYQFYSSSIVSGLLRPTVMKIDSFRKLEESGLNVGIEDINILTRMIKIFSETNPYVRRIIEKKVKPKSEYLLARDGVKKVKQGHYAFFTDPAISYWLINDIFTEREKCDLSELPVNRPEACAYLVPKRSPYKKLINFASNILLETGLMNRELGIWHAKKPKCIAGKTMTEESLVSVGIKDITSLIAFLTIALIVSLIILVLEMITFRYNSEKVVSKNRST